MQNAEERASKVALVIKAAVHRYGRYRRVRLAEGGARLLDSVAVKILDGCEVKALFEMPLESAEGEAAFLGEVLQLDLICVVRGDVLNGTIEG